MAHLVYYTTVLVRREERTFDFLYLTEGKEKQNNVVHSFYKLRYKLDSGWDSYRYRGWKFFIVVWDGATAIGLVSKTKTRHNIVFVFFFSNPGLYVKHTPKGVHRRHNIWDQTHTHTPTHTTGDDSYKYHRTRVRSGSYTIFVCTWYVCMYGHHV